MLELYQFHHLLDVVHLMERLVELVSCSIFSLLAGI